MKSTSNCVFNFFNHRLTRSMKPDTAVTCTQGHCCVGGGSSKFQPLKIITFQLVDSFLAFTLCHMLSLQLFPHCTCVWMYHGINNNIALNKQGKLSVDVMVLFLA